MNLRARPVRGGLLALSAALALAAGPGCGLEITRRVGGERFDDEEARRLGRKFGEQFAREHLRSGGGGFGGSGAVGGGAVERTASDPVLRLKRDRDAPGPGGLYALEGSLAFNVLEGASFNQAAGTITLYGRFDPAWAGPAIPWLQHLAELLDNPDPEFTLGWTAESEARVDAFLDKTESRAEVDAVSSQWGDLIQGREGVSPVGRLLLPGLGVHPTKSGAGPGSAGFTTRDAGIRPGIDKVLPGSGAERGGLKDGDIVKSVDGREPLNQKDLLRRIRVAGAGARMRFVVTRLVTTQPLQFGDFSHDVVLDAGTGDPWEGMGSNEVAACVFRAAGMTDAAEVTCAIGEYHANQENDLAWRNLLASLGLLDHWDRGDREIRAGRMDKDKAIVALMGLMAAALDRVYGFEGAPVRKAFYSGYTRRSDPETGLEAAFDTCDRLRKGSLARALDTLWRRPDGVLIPPGLVEMSYGVRPEVRPEYLGVNPKSRLARVMFEADYQGKRLLHAPWLARTIPGYVTVFRWDRERRSASAPARWTEARRLWISTAGIDAVTSPDGSTLEIRGARMRFNMRGIGADGASRPSSPGGYEELLTSLYDPLSREIPVLHELRECAKVASVAKWIRARRADARLPREGREAWDGPAVLPGLVFMVLYPPTGPSRHDCTVVAAGGASLKHVLEPFPSDPGVVDLRGSPLTVMPQATSSEGITRVMGLKTKAPPEWHPEGWVTKARKGEKLVEAFTVALDGKPEDYAASEAVRRKLEEGHRIAVQLAQVERTINLISGKNVDRQAEFRGLGDDLQQASDEFVDHTLSILTQGLLSLKDQTRYRDLAVLAGEAAAAKDATDAMLSRLGRLETLWKAAKADNMEKRSEAAKELAGMLKDLVEEMGPNARGPLAPYLRAAGKSLGWASNLGDAAGIAGNLATLYSAGRRIQDLNLEVEKDNRILDSILPLQRGLSDRIDAIRKDPEVLKALKLGP
jgi:hypothetical protein